MLVLAANAVEAVPRSTRAILDADRRCGEDLICSEERLRGSVESIEDRCFRRIALQQPAAHDLRCLLTAMRLASEFGRVHSLASNIARAAVRLDAPPEDARVRGLLQRMSDEAQLLLRSAVDAYANEDVTAAMDVRRLDEGLDALHRHFVSRVLDACRDGRTEVWSAVQLALIGRFYERIGDHAVNVAERVVFMATGSRPAPTPDAGLVALHQVP